jgi:hypothetical protein
MFKLNGIVRSRTVLHPYSAGTVLSVIWLVRIFSEERRDFRKERHDKRLRKSEGKKNGLLK